MAKKETLKFYCDNCKVEGDPDYENSGRGNSGAPLPVGWATINIASDEGHMFDGELCDKCLTGIFNAIKKRYKEDGE